MSLKSQNGSLGQMLKLMYKCFEMKFIHWSLEGVLRNPESDFSSIRLNIGLRALPFRPHYSAVVSLGTQLNLDLLALSNWRDGDSPPQKEHNSVWLLQVQYVHVFMH